MIFKHEKDSKDLSSSSISNLEFDSNHESNEPNTRTRFIDTNDENNNITNTSNNSKNQNYFHPPVRFVTHFSNIREDED